MLFSLRTTPRLAVRRFVGCVAPRELAVTTREVLNAAAISRALTRIASEIVERNGGVKDVALVGIRSRGVPLAERLALKLEKAEGIAVPTGTLDITLYRDDLHAAGPQLTLQPTSLPFREEEVTVILVDDVLHTGRTVRAALDALVDYGRPRRIQLAVLIDRGGRELPIAASYVGKVVQAAPDQNVRVQLKEIDGSDRVTIETAAPADAAPGDGA
jgi:pyrimidine operon attenuation protein/uracil phosphoribosyltransferase